MRQITDKEIKLILGYRADWNKFGRDVYGLKLDQSQQDIVWSIQNNSRVAVRSGTARGKDYVGAFVANAFHDLFIPSKVICTAPTGRQAIDIMMGEISTQRRNARFPVGGTILTNKIKHETYENWYLEAFKGEDKNIEAWSGFHSDNIMVVMTEASGMNEIIYETVEGILQNNSRFVIFFNPNRLSGEAYRATKSSRYVNHTLSDLDAPNVLSYLEWQRKEITEEQYRATKIPGQVDGEWVNDKIIHTGWCREITEIEARAEYHDFEWIGKWYRPSNLFKIKVLGEFPEEDESTLIPMPWLDAAVDRWKAWNKSNKAPAGNKKIGSDIAGEGRDSTVHVERYDNLLWKIHEFGMQKHMEAAGYITNLRKRGDWVMVDTIGEGAGVYSRLEELNVPNIISFKNSHGAKGLRDETGQLQFANMRAYVYWAIRDWLNPQFGHGAMIPPNDRLSQELNETRYEYRSDGRIAIESKDDIKKRLGRSPDLSDALSMTFSPIKKIATSSGASSIGLF